MRLDTVTAEIRPRGDWEAVDLGLAMVRRDFWRCFAVWWLAVILPTVVTGWWLWESPMLWLMLFWWWKPAGSRVVLFELSRRLFGEQPAWTTTMREIPRAWTRRFWYRFVWARLSPWLPVTLAVDDLEDLRGKAYQKRCRQLVRRGDSVVMWVYAITDMAACWFGWAILLVVKMFVPEGQDGAWRVAVESYDPSHPLSLPVLLLRTLTVCVMLAMSLTDVFVTGAGFGVYLNNRTWIEGWDVELALKRLSQRLTKVVLLVMVLWVTGWPMVVSAATGRDPAEVIREVKADAAFKVHTVVEKVPADSHPWFSWEWPQWLLPGPAPAWLGDVLMVTAIALMAGAILWLLWHNRLLFRKHSGASNKSAVAPKARVVMGMEVAPETLPADVPTTVWALWRQGRQQAAMGLLYRAAISCAIDVGRVEIQESDTEGECLRRVKQAGPSAQAEYFHRLTAAWIRLAYAGLCPEDGEIETLCVQWPFAARRDG